MSSEIPASNQKFQDIWERKFFKGRLDSTEAIITLLQNLYARELAKLNGLFSEWKKTIKDKFICVLNSEIKQKGPKDVFTTLLKLREKLIQLQGQSGEVTQVVGEMQAEIESKIEKGFKEGMSGKQGFCKLDLPAIQRLNIGDVIPDAQMRILGYLGHPSKKDLEMGRPLQWFADTPLGMVPLELHEAFKSAAQAKFETLLADALEKDSLELLVCIKSCVEALEAIIPGCGERADKVAEELFQKRLAALDPDIFDEDFLRQIEPMIPDATEQAQAKIKAWFEEGIASDDLGVLNFLRKRQTEIEEIIPGAPKKIEKQIEEVQEGIKKNARRSIGELLPTTGQNADSEED